MQADLENQKLPKVYKRNGKDCYLDNIRQRLIYITPEETVRQQIVSYLINNLHVPVEMIRVEEHLAHYGIDTKRRADIIIERLGDDDIRRPLAVIECKAPQISISQKVFDQMFDYADMLGADYVMATNGYDAQYYHYNEQRNVYEATQAFSSYEKLLKGKCKPLPAAKHYDRLSLDELIKDEKWKEYLDYSIGKSTPVKIARAAGNFWDSLGYSEAKMPVGKYQIFRLIEDYGIRTLEYGNASGGSFPGNYHSYLVEYNGNTEFVSIGLSTYVTSAHMDKERTSLNVAIDNEKTSHHSLQMILDDNMAVVGDKCTFYHHGRITVGNKGAGKIDELRMFVKDRYPNIVDGSRFNLGTLVNDHLWNADEDDMMLLLENLISYALIRDEYREYVKKKDAYSK